MNNDIDLNVTIQKLLAITVENESVLERLRANELVEDVEEDHTVSTLIIGQLLEKLVVEEGGDIIPYGIRMVEADDVWDLPKIVEDTTVCVVDTGFDLGHPVSLSMLSPLVGSLLLVYIIIITECFLSFLFCNFFNGNQYQNTEKDLPSILLNGVSGTNTYSGDWFLDEDGHRTHLCRNNWCCK